MEKICEEKDITKFNETCLKIINRYLKIFIFSKLSSLVAIYLEDITSEIS